MRKELELQQNITYIEIKDKTEIPKIRERIKRNESLEGLNIGKVYNKQNRIVNAGLNAVCRALAGDDELGLEINYGALGTGTEPVSASGEVMENEVFRKLASESSYEGTTAYVDFFFDKSDTEGTFTRFANFIGGEDVKDTGAMWSHIAVDWVKTLNDGLFISCRYKVSYKS